MKKFIIGTVIFALFINLVLFINKEEQEVILPLDNIKFQEQVNDKMLAAQVSYDEAVWAWRASHGVLDNFVDNYNGNIVTKEEWLNLSETEREDLLRNGQ